MKFSSPRSIEQICWQLRLADYPRSINRARINSLANGAQPYTAEEVLKNAYEVNVNDLSLTRLSHDARQQLAQAFNKPGNFFKATTDGGVSSKRRERSVTVTKEITRLMKRSDSYFECMRSAFAQDVLHGIGPSNWEGMDRWRPIPLGIEDVYVPGNTILPLDDVPFFAVFRPYTPAKLRYLTRHRDRAKAAGWNLNAVDAAVKWAEQEAVKMGNGNSFSQYWSPEKQEERLKSDSGIYGSDLVPTIDCLDFYYWDDSGNGKKEGWRRKIVFDAEGGNSAWYGSGSYGDRKQMPSKNLLGEDKGVFVFDSGNRVVADSMAQIMHFQFADLSAVAPFHYHGIRSLGFLLYAACHLQNRLRCAFSEAVFENLLMYLRVRTEDDSQRALNIQLGNRRIVDDTIQFIPPGERYQPNYQLAELGLNEFKQIIADNSSSYVQNQNLSRDRVEKTKFQVMAEVNAMQTLVSAALQQAYRYQTSQFREIFRRFTKRHSVDPEVNEFRARCLVRGVPDKLLVADAWDIEPERILGGGNKTLEMAIAQQLMEWRAAFAPEAQQDILRDATLAITDDAARAESLVPRAPGISDSRHDAMVSFGTLMAGAPVQLTRDQNRLEVAQTWLLELATVVKQATEMGNMASMDKVIGFQNVLQHIGGVIAEIGADPTQKEAARQLADMSGKLANLVKGFAQRAQEQMQAGAEGGNGEAEQAKAKIAATIMQAQVKAKNAEESHGQRTAQKQVQFEAAQAREEQKHQLEVRRTLKQQEVEDSAKLVGAVADVQRKELEPAPTKAEP